MTILVKAQVETQVEKLKSLVPDRITYRVRANSAGEIVRLETDNQRLIDFAISKGLVIQ
jgi:hypothetical protein